MRRKRKTTPSPVAAPPGFAVFKGHGFAPVTFPALPGLMFRPGVPVAVTPAQAALIERGRLGGLSLCEEPPETAPPTAASPENPATGPANKERE
jgi:hypothetical protein